MAFRNVFREKKRAVLVFASLFLGTMAFLSTNAFVDSMKLENYVKYYLPNDYTIYVNCGSEQEGTEEEQIQKNIKSAEEMAQKIQALDGITDVSIHRYEDVTLPFDETLFQPFLESFNHFFTGKFDLKNLRKAIPIRQKVIPQQLS